MPFPPINSDDAMVVTTNAMTSVSLSIFGEPVSQPRWRYHLMPRLRVPKWVKVVTYNPATREKSAFRLAVSNALVQVGATTFPIFADRVKVKVKVTFHVINVQKDIDNLLKFLMDALQSIFYNNDNMVYCVVATKIRTMTNLEYTEFEAENMSEEDQI